MQALASVSQAGAYSRVASDLDLTHGAAAGSSGERFTARSGFLVSPSVQEPCLSSALITPQLFLLKLATRFDSVQMNPPVLWQPNSYAPLAVMLSQRRTRQKCALRSPVVFILSRVGPEKSLAALANMADLATLGFQDVFATPRQAIRQTPSVDNAEGRGNASS
jgi:hypothetical protein